jgi:hypothetical protein
MGQRQPARRVGLVEPTTALPPSIRALRWSSRWKESGRGKQATICDHMSGWEER